MILAAEEHMRAAKKPGWIVLSEVLGMIRTITWAKIYSSLGRHGLGVIVCLNNGYFPQGTLPLSSEYAKLRPPLRQFCGGKPGMQPLGDRQRDELCHRAPHHGGGA